MAARRSADVFRRHLQGLNEILREIREGAFHFIGRNRHAHFPQVDTVKLLRIANQRAVALAADIGDNTAGDSLGAAQVCGLSP